MAKRTKKTKVTAHKKVSKRSVAKNTGRGSSVNAAYTYINTPTPLALKKRVVIAARKQGLSRAEWVRQAIKAFLAA